MTYEDMMKESNIKHEANVERLDYLKESMEKIESNLKESMCRLENKLDRFIDKADKKYAPHWVADVMKYIGGGIGIIIIGALMSLILIK